MKKSELRQIIREEIFHIVKEDVYGTHKPGDVWKTSFYNRPEMKTWAAKNRAGKTRYFQEESAARKYAKS